MPVEIQRHAFADFTQEKPAGLTKQQEIAANPDAVVIPREFGLIKSKFTGNAGKLIIHIQDAHCNYEAQSNIAKMLESLVKNYNLSFVAVEGADGVIDTSWFKAFPDDEVRKEVAAYFMKKGEITGPEYLSITTNYPIKLFGAETRSYYIQNLNAFTSSFPYKEATEQYYGRIKIALNRLKAFIYSDDLKKLDARSQEYESKRIKFNDYVRFLQDMAEKHKINLREYDNFFRLVSVLVYEKKIDFNFTDKERNVLIDELSRSISKDELTELVNASMSFKMAKTSSADYYSFLKSAAAKNDIDMAKRFPNLYNYIIYNSTYSKIENEKLFHDMKEIEKAIKEKLFTNDDQRTLEKLSRHVDVLLGLVNIKLLNGDYEYYKLHKDEFSYEAFAVFLKKGVQTYGLLYDIEPPVEGVLKSVPRLEEFYEIAIKRDTSLVENTLSEMDGGRQQLAVLVTGGFHSEGMAKILEKQGVSYLVVCPAITKDVPTPYLKILTNQRTSFEDILVDTALEVKEGAMQPILIARLASLSDDEIKRLLSQSPVAEGELTVLINDIVGRADNFRRGWMAAGIGRWLVKALRVAGTNQYGRDVNTMKEAYVLAMETGVARSILEEKKLREANDSAALNEAERTRVAAIVKGITGSAEFNAAFDSIHERMTRRTAVDSFTQGPPAGGGTAAAGQLTLTAAQGIAEALTGEDSAEHKPAQIQASSAIGEHVRAIAEVRSQEVGTFEAERHIIFVESAIPAGQPTNTHNIPKRCAQYYERHGYTVHIVKDHNEAIGLLRQNAGWNKNNTIMGLVSRNDLDAIETALKAEGMQDKSKLLALAVAEKDSSRQYIPVKGFFDLMGTIVNINRPLSRENDRDRELLDGIRDLLRTMGVEHADTLVDALTAADFFTDPIKAARNFIITLLPRAKAFEGKELRSRYEAALAAVRSL